MESALPNPTLACALPAYTSTNGLSDVLRDNCRWLRNGSETWGPMDTSDAEEGLDRSVVSGSVTATRETQVSYTAFETSMDINST